MARERGEEQNRDGLQLKPAPGPLALVQEFVNTRNIMRGYDLLEDPEGAAGWLAVRGLLGGDARLTGEEWDCLVQFREGLRGLVLAHYGGPEGGGIGVLTARAGDALLTCATDV